MKPLLETPDEVGNRLRIRLVIGVVVILATGAAVPLTCEPTFEKTTLKSGKTVLEGTGEVVVGYGHTRFAQKVFSDGRKGSVTTISGPCYADVLSGGQTRRIRGFVLELSAFTPFGSRYTVAIR